MAYKVSLSQRAIRDLNAIFEAKHAETSRPAAAWFLGLRDTIFSLSSLPERGLVAHDNPNYRQLTYGNKPHIYRILYLIDREKFEVNVVQVRHGARVPLHH